ncbi:efflux RND transporter permease subunit [Sporosarcina contaminans]|uniref:Efflux RND transporter permease subunit n=1 Tax=Sporosarcina contaminans TaxID=633403 RepID=A0ABW3TXK9_9BACL
MIDTIAINEKGRKGLQVYILKTILRKKVLVGLLAFLVVTLGCYAIVKLDKEILPYVAVDVAYVQMDTGDTAAIDVEQKIINPLEQRLNAIEGVEEIVSRVSLGRSELQITLERGRGDELVKDVELAANSIKAEQPEIREMAVGLFSTNQDYGYFMDITGSDRKAMTAFATDILKPRLESLQEVKDVHLTGLLEHEISIRFDQDKLTKYGLSLQQIIPIIAQSDREATLGELQDGQETSWLIWDTKFKSKEDIEQIEIPNADGSVLLKELSEISFDPVETSSFVWKNGSNNLLFVQVGSTSNTNQIDLAKAVRAEVEKIREEGLVEGFTLNEMLAQSDFVQDSIDDVTGNILIGSIVAICILLLFLRNIRATIIIGISIPTSVLLTFLAMFVLGYSLNMLTLIGLGLGVGMMVDSSIVILESIYRQRELGLSNRESVLVGTKEVAGAVLSSMLTTIVVFLPIGFIGGEMGLFMVILSIVVAVTLISSVVVAFTLIPILSDQFLRFKKRNYRENRFLKNYEKVISWIVRKKRRSVFIIVSFFALFVGSLLLVNRVPMTVMPDIFNRYTELLIELEEGVTLDEKQQAIRKVNAELEKIDDVETVYLLDNGDMIAAIINMTKGEEIQKGQKEVNEEITSSLRLLVDSTPIKSVQSSLEGFSEAPVQVLVKGDDFEQLQQSAGAFMEKIKEIEGIVGIRSTADYTSAEERIVLKNKAIREAGLMSDEVRQFIEQAFIRMPIGEVRIDKESVPIIIGWANQTATAQELLNLEIPTESGSQKLSSLIELKTVQTPNEIAHLDGERFIAISGEIEGRDLGAINRDVQKVINEFEIPAGYTLMTGGDLEQQQQLVIEMLMVIGVALFLVYLVMAVQFNHLGHPIIVMSIIPMAIIGVIVGLFITQMELNLLSAMGIVMLIGIVLNNAILLIDRTKQLRDEGLSVEEALIEAGKNRIRPIFMTTLTTVGGMLPLALSTGISGNYQGPLAVVLISGLLFATFITLLLIPSIYRVFTFKEKVKQKESFAIGVKRQPVASRYSRSDQ